MEIVNSNRPVTQPQNPTPPGLLAGVSMIGGRKGSCAGSPRGEWGQYILFHCSGKEPISPSRLTLSSKGTSQLACGLQGWLGPCP